MSGMPSIMKSIAKRIGRLPSIEYRSYYPAPVRIGNSPSVIVRQSNDSATTYSKSRIGGVQNVVAYVEAIVMFEIVEKQKRPGDEMKLDPIAEQIVDLFDFREAGSGPNWEMPDLDIHVSQIFSEAEVRRGQITYGQQECYAALITLNVQFQRSPEDLILLPDVSP